ncbi:SCP-like protein, partial [Ostertagia ostertagi]
MTGKRNFNVTNKVGSWSRLAQGLVPNGVTGMRAPAGSNIFYMKYSTNLENAAQMVANSCLPTGSNVTTRPGYGENVATIPQYSATSPDVAVQQAIKQFWHEIYMYSVNSKMIFTVPLLNKGTMAPLRFTQMAWASTYEVGCGVQTCSGNYLVVCRYYP